MQKEAIKAEMLKKYNYDEGDYFEGGTKDAA